MMKIKTNVLHSYKVSIEKRMMPQGKITNLAFMTMVILSSADVRSASLLQLHVIKEGQTNMKDVVMSVVFMCCLQEQEIISIVR